MKHSITTIVIIGIFIISSIGLVTSYQNTSNNTIETTLSFSQPDITTSQEYIELRISEQTSYLSQKGAPKIPLISKEYIFPFGTTITDITVTFSEETTQKISLPVAPATEAKYISTEFSNTCSENEIDESIYSSTDSYPKDRWWYRTGCGLHQSERVLYVTVFLSPIQYQPSVSTITNAETADIIITYDLPEHQTVSADEYEFLILATEEFSPHLQPLVVKKQTLGIDTKLVTLETIPDIGTDMQESIKLYIKDAIETWGITHVLLVGSGLDDNEKFPVRNAWVASGTYERYFPSDLYYADIYNATGEFSTWDNNSNGRYAEYPADNAAVDLYPDVALGRLPCNTTEEVDIIVNKIITFMETNTLSHTIVQMGGDTFPDDPENIYEGEFANEEVMKRLPSYQTTQLWGSTNTLKRFNIIFEIFKGVDFVDFSGHGSYVSWATHAPENEDVWLPKGLIYDGFVYLDVNWLFNFHKLPVVVFNACSCSKFSEFDPCLSWSIVKKEYGGAIASFGASGIGYGSYGSTETDRLFGWMEVNLFEKLANDKELGKTWKDAITEYINAFEFNDADYKTIYELALFGDPTLEIKDYASS